MRNPRAFLPPVLGLTFLVLFGCAVDKGGSDPEAGDGGLPAGHYLLDQNMDGELGTQTWFVLLPDSAWEVVHYFISYGNAVCGIGRTRGTYSMGDTSLALFAEESADGPDNCPITQADFDNLTWEALPEEEGEVLDIRNVTAHSFQARGAFAGPDWRIFHRQDDPHGYYD